ncbi:hypothetical protein ACO0RG_003578 [Hanseniaspora osmophila]
MKVARQGVLIFSVALFTCTFLMQVVKLAHSAEIDISQSPSIGRDIETKTDVAIDNFRVPEASVLWQCVKQLKSIILLLDEERNAGEMSKSSSVINNLYGIIYGLDLSDDIEQYDSNADDSDLFKKAHDYLWSISPSYAALFKSYYEYNIYDLPSSSQPNFKVDKATNFFVINNKVYENSDDIFYLKSHKIKTTMENLDMFSINEDELIIGLSKEAPLAFFYGCDSLDNKDEFEEFNNNLWNEAQGGKIRYVLRRFCIDKSNNYPWNDNKKFVDLSFLKNNLHDFDYNGETININHNENATQLMDLQLTDFIIKYHNSVENNKNAWNTLNFTKNIINKLPFESVQDKCELLHTGDVEDYSSITEDLDALMQLGVNYDMLGVFVNGVNIRLTDFSMKSLIESIQREFRFLKIFKQIASKHDIKLTVDDMKRLITDFTVASQLFIKNNQPRRFDVTQTIDKNSDVVIFANDLENDLQYASTLSTDPLEFMTQKSHFGEIPAYAENWNDVIFITDFQNKEMVDGLIRALEVVQNGYPQRIGILPLPKSFESMENDQEYMKIISQLQKIGNSNIDGLLKFLNDGKGLKFDKRLNLLDPTSPVVSSILSTIQLMKITENSIMVNGQLFGFRENVWQYLISTIIKEDVGFLKSALPVVMKDWEEQGHSMRKLLYAEAQAFVSRDLVLTPNIHGDSTYSIENLDGLEEIIGQGRVFEYVKSDVYNVVHTLSVIDDFENPSAWDSLSSILNLHLYGVKLRLIHNGGESKNWNALKSLLSKTDVLSSEELLQHAPNVNPNKEKHKLDFSQWLVDLSYEQLSSTKFLVLNGRVINLENHTSSTLYPLTPNDYFNLIKHESIRSLQTIKFVEKYHLGQIIPPSLIEEFSAFLTKIYYDDMLLSNGIDFTVESILPRLPLRRVLNKKSVLKSNSLFLHSKSKKRPIDLTLVLDPMEERSQTFISHAAQLMDTGFQKFLNLEILLLPTKDLKFFSIQRLYYDSQELEKVEKHETIDIETKELELHVDMTAPDLTLDGKSIWCTAYVQDAAQEISRLNVESVGSNICVNVVNACGNIITSFQSMQTFGFGQFKLPLNETNEKYHFELCSINSGYTMNGFTLDVRTDVSYWSEFSVHDFFNRRAYIQVAKTDDERVPSPVGSDMLNVLVTLQNKDSEEEFMSLYSTLSKNFPNGFKIWVWKQDHHGVDKIAEKILLLENVELVSYKWPKWLRPTKLDTNKLNLGKFLFLDMVLPADAVNVVYLDLKEIDKYFMQSFVTDIDVVKSIVLGKEDFTIGMVPYGDDEHGYWEDGYWKEYLESNKLDFFKANNFIVNLKNFREAGLGDILRVHYQQISQDIFSLRSYGQDLINNIQLKAKIYALDAVVDESLDLQEDDIVHDEL